MFRIPIPKTGGEVLNEGIQKLMERLMKQKEMENEAAYRNATLSLSERNSASENAYKNAMLSIAQQKGAREQNEEPVNLKLLEAKIQAEKALANQRNNPKSSVNKETPEEKMNREVKTADVKAENASTRKKLDKIEQQADELSTKMQRAVNAHNILSKNPNAVGYTSAGKYYTGFGDEDTASLNEIFGLMQADLAKEYSQRGSVYGTKLAGNRKPNLRYQSKQNLGLLGEINKDYYQRYKAMERDYKRLSGGKELPIPLNEHYKMVKVRSPKGDVYIKTPSEARQLLTKYPKAQILGQVYE
jgi:hypothetical protein